MFSIGQTMTAANGTKSSVRPRNENPKPDQPWAPNDVQNNQQFLGRGAIRLAGENAVHIAAINR